MDNLSADQIDALAIGFTVFASIWLIFTVIYLTTICIYFRMRLRGHLEGSMTDPAWGRAYLLGSSRFYISLGWLFRRYMMYQRSSEERARIARIRVMSKEERRAALVEILEPSTYDNIASFSAKLDQNRHDNELKDHDLLHATPKLSFVVPANKGCGEPVCIKISEPEQAMPIQQTALDKAHEVRSQRPCSDSRLPRTSNGVSDDLRPQLPICSSSVLGDPCDDAASFSSADTKSLPEHETPSNQSEADSLRSSFGQPECPICFVEYQVGQTYFQSSKCAHHFHWDCIILWLEIQSNRDCPCCRMEILPEERIWDVVQRQRKEKRRLRKGIAPQPKSIDDISCCVPMQRVFTEDAEDELDGGGVQPAMQVCETNNLNVDSMDESNLDGSNVRSEYSMDKTVLGGGPISIVRGYDDLESQSQGSLSRCSNEGTHCEVSCGDEQQTRRVTSGSIVDSETTFISVVST